MSEEADNLQWCEKSTASFIAILEEKKVLWDTTHPYRTDAAHRYLAFRAILDEMKKYFPQATLANMRNKFRVVRDLYIKELKDIEINKNNGVAQEPSWFVKELEFMRPHIKPTKFKYKLTKYKDMKGNIRKKECIKWQRSAVVKLIALFESKKILYDPYYKGYKDINQRNLAYDAIRKELKNDVPNASIRDIRARTQNLSGQYRKEIININIRQQEGKSRRPRLWCFKEMSFLRPFIATRSTKFQNTFTSDVNDDERTEDSDSESDKPKKIKWTNEQIEKIIELFKDRKILYDYGLDSYTNVPGRHAAMKSILKIMSQEQPEATLADIRSKIAYLRYNYRRELKKIISSQRNGKVRKPTLWYYSKMEFLRPYIRSKDVIQEEKNSECNSTQETENNDLNVFYNDNSNSNHCERTQDTDSDLDKPKERIVWTKKQIEKMIKLYKERRILYDYGLDSYTNFSGRHDAMISILAELRQYQPEATLEDLRAKIAYLRFNYRRELKKVLVDQQNGKVRNPTLWYYYKLDFLQPYLRSKQILDLIEEGKSGKCYMEAQKENNDFNVDCYDDNKSYYGDDNAEKIVCDDTDDDNNDCEEVCDPLISDKSEYITTSRVEPLVDISEVYIEETQELEPLSPSYEITNATNQFSESSLSGEEFEAINNNLESTHTGKAVERVFSKADSAQLADEAELFAKGWALQYHRLTKDQKLYTKKAIDAIFFEAKHGTLNRQSVRINKVKYGK